MTELDELCRLTLASHWIAGVRHHARLESERDLHGDGLLGLIQPDESGPDASPQFDPIWGRRAQGQPGFVALVAHSRRLGFDIGAIRAAGGPIVCEVLTNVLHGLCRLALGQPSITPALLSRLYDHRTGLFAALPEPPLDQPLPPPSSS